MNVLIILPGFIPSTIIGVLRPLANLESIGKVKLRIRLNNISFFQKKDIYWCDVAVFCRNTEIKDLITLYHLKRENKKIIFDIDDNFEEIPLSTAVGVYHRVFYRLHVLRRFYQLSDITRVYSDRMYKLATMHGANVLLTRSYFDGEIIKSLPKRKLSNGIIKIAYPTGRIDDVELESRIFTAVKMILQKYAGKVEIHLWRKTIPLQLIGVDGVVINKSVNSYESFIRLFYSGHFDIGLAPGVNTSFFHSKTNNKYREFGGCGVAGIYSNYPPYSNSVVNGKTGLLVDDSIENWIEALETLISNVELRDDIVFNSFADISLNYSFSASVRVWHDSLESLRFKPPRASRFKAVRNDFALYGFVYLDVNKKSNTNTKTLKYLRQALDAFGSNFLYIFNEYNDYLKNTVRFKLIACVFVIEKSKQVSQLVGCLSHSLSGIVDITNYSDDLNDLLVNLKGSSKIPTTLLITELQSSSLELLQSEFEFIIVENTRPLVEIQDFSLAGYPSAYMDALEVHLQYGVESKLYFDSHRITNYINLVGNLYRLYKSRIRTIYSLAKYRMGFRSF